MRYDDNDEDDAPRRKAVALMTMLIRRPAMVCWVGERMGTTW